VFDESEMRHMADPVEESLPRGIALSWAVAERPQRGPKRELSIERIVEAAIEIADAEGLGAVSMSRVATSLGYTTMSLYRYVTSKDDLLVLMQDAVATVPLPEQRPGSEWRQALREWVTANIAVFREHPWFVDIPISGVPMTPSNLAFVDAALGAMRDLPIDDDEKMGTILLLSSYTMAWARILKDVSSGPGDSGVAEALKQLVSAERFPYLSPIVQAGLYSSGGNESGVDDFSYGLERILDGIQSFVDEIERSGSRPTPPKPDRKAAHAELNYPRDAAVRDATRLRREAESKAREARKHELEFIAKAKERAAKAAEKETERAKRDAERVKRDEERARRA
jgi:AcrR family transcriptional regulator